MYTKSQDSKTLSGRFNPLSEPQVPQVISIDRIEPTRRPNGNPIGRQQWRDLLFLHWSVSVDELRKLVPPSLELDLWDNTAFVGLVPFQMKSVQPWNWWPKLFAFEFLETNVRTYVHYQGRPGVYFFSLDAASWLAVKAARTLWSLPYYHAAMQSEHHKDQKRYTAQRRGNEATSDVAFTVGEPVPTPPPDSIEFFFLERYLLFTERGGKIVEGQVHHTPYPVHRAELVICDDGLLAAAEIQTAGEPAFTHYSPGVDVDIFPLRQLT